MKVELEKILAVSGKSGLYKIISNGKNGIVVESIAEGKRIAVTTTQKISSLNDITMFTTDEDVKLREVLLKAKEVFESKPAPDPKSDSKIVRETMLKILPNYDAEKVYDSDIRKLLTWYNLLQSKDMLEFTEIEEESEKGSAIAEASE